MADTMTYLLRDIPSALHRRLKIKAAEDGVSIRDIILAAIEKSLCLTTREDLTRESDISEEPGK